MKVKHNKRDRTDPSALRKETVRPLRQDENLNNLLACLPDRKLLLQLLQQAVSTAERDGSRLALLIMDIDRFKEINFSVGHHIGDRVLQEVALRLQGILRESDRLVRTGDDEFVILLPAMISEDHAMLAVYKIQDMLEDPFIVESHNYIVSMSIGIALYPDAGRDVETLLRNASMAMYRAKEARSGFSIYKSADTDKKISNLMYEKELRRVLNDNALLVYYQPKHNLHTKMICGAEALARLPDSAIEPIGPDKFIQVAEQSDLIHSLTLWVLNAALRQLASWHSEGMIIRISVNLSPINLHDPDFPDLVARALNTWRIPSEYLELEITETAIMQYRSHIVDVLNRLDDIGLSLSIDDFGTGYSSLTYLRRLPVDELKIAKEFVSTMEKDMGNELIVRAVIDLAHSFGLRVTAEGVEDEVTYNLLKDINCDIAQGLYISPPLPADEFMKVLREDISK